MPEPIVGSRAVNKFTQQRFEVLDVKEKHGNKYVTIDHEHNALRTWHIENFNRCFYFA